MYMYPNAKVILTVRDDPEKWYRSVRDAIKPYYDSTKDFPHSLATAAFFGKWQYEVCIEL